MLSLSRRILNSHPNLIVDAFDTPHVPCDKRTAPRSHEATDMRRSADEWGEEWGSKETGRSQKVKSPCSFWLQGLLTGGVDGTRTRDPRRDRPVF